MDMCIGTCTFYVHYADLFYMYIMYTLLYYSQMAQAVTVK